MFKELCSNFLSFSSVVWMRAFECWFLTRRAVSIVGDINLWIIQLWNRAKLMVETKEGVLVEGKQRVDVKTSASSGCGLRKERPDSCS